MLGDGGLGDVEYPRSLRDIRLLGDCFEDGESVVHGYGCSSVGENPQSAGLDYHAARLYAHLLEPSLIQDAGSNVSPLS